MAASIAAPAGIPIAPAIKPVAVKIEPVTFTVHFDFAQADIRASAMQILYGAAQKAKRSKPGIVKIRGFTDAAGKREFNLKLAQSRAEAVAGQLRKLGIRAQIEIVATEIIGAEAGKPKKDPANRKVEITFVEFPDVTATTVIEKQPAPSPGIDAPSTAQPLAAAPSSEAPFWPPAVLRDERGGVVWNIKPQRPFNLHLS